MKTLGMLLLVFPLSVASAAPPSIAKVEPPDWAAEAEGIAREPTPFPTGRVAISTAGTLLFPDLTLPSHASSGANLL